MHIVQLLPELTQGGVERSVIKLSRELVRLGHQSTVISSGGNLAGQIEADGGRHITLDLCSKNPLTVPKRILDLRRVIADLSPDLLHAHSRVPAWLFTFANQTLRIPFVTTVHGFNHISRYSRVMTQGDRVITVSDQVRDYIQKHYATAAGKISVIPCGVDSQEFDPARLDQEWIREFKDRFNLNGKKVATAVGRISRSKDYETFIRGIAICAKENPDIRGLIVGSPRPNHRHYLNQLKSLAQELQLDDTIIFAGPQTRMSEIYGLSDVIVSSSKKPETFGLTLIESMAMNTPVIATRHGGPLDIITEGQNGRFFTPAEAEDLAAQITATLYAPPRELRTETIRRFSAEATAREIVAIYENLLNTLHVVQLVPELNQGGVERGVVEFNRELVKRGHRSTVISAGGKMAGQIEQDGGRLVVLDVCSKNPLTAPGRISNLRKTLAELRPDILHARSRVPAWLCHFAKKKLSVPFVTTVHGFNSISRYSEIMTTGERVIYGSASIKEYILKNYAVDESKLRYVPRGIDMDLFDPNKTDSRFVSEFKKKHQLENRIVVSIVGRITEWKGHEIFIRSLAEVQKNHPGVVGLAAGGIWHGKEEFFQGLEKLAKELGADIRFVGSQTQVREIYALSDLVVSAASSKAETFGRTAAEALAMNTPVIASAHGGSLDILIDGENGLLFEPGNGRDLAEKIEQALTRPFENMREHIQENFSLDRMTEDELAVYRELAIKSI